MPNTSVFLKAIIQHSSLSVRCQFHTTKKQLSNYSFADFYFYKFVVGWIQFWFVRVVNKYMICYKFWRDLLYMLWPCPLFFSQSTNLYQQSFNFQLLTSYRRISPHPRHCLMVCNIVRFCGEQLLAPLTNNKLEDHPLSDRRDSLFNVLAATVHNKLLQFHYLLLLPVARCEAMNSISFLRFFHCEYVPSWNWPFPQQGNISNASQQPDTLHFWN